MNLLQRAFLYNTRKIGKGSLLFLIFFIMSVTVLTGLAINFSASAAIKELRESIGGSFFVEEILDKENLELWKLKEDGTSSYYIGPSIDDELIQRVMSVGGIREYNTEISSYLYGDDLNLVGGLMENGMIEYPDYTDPEDELWLKVTSVIGNLKSATNTYFRTGSFELVDGRHINEKDQGKALISSELAKRSQLKIGDTFRVSMRAAIINNERDFWKVIGNPFELEIVGIFKVNSGLQASIWSPESSISDNLIFTDMMLPQQLKSYIGNQKIAYDTSTFFVKDPKELAAIMKKVKARNVVDLLYFRVEEDDSTYRSSAAPLKTINLYINVLSGIVLSTCAILLYFILSMWIKGRTKETGILRAIGVSKTSIVFQYIVECFIIAIFASGLSFVVSKGIANQLGNQVLEFVTPEQEETMKTITEEEIRVASLAGTLGDEEFTVVAPPSNTPKSLNISVGIREFFVVVLIGAVLICISVYRNVSKDLRRNLKDILM